MGLWYKRTSKRKKPVAGKFEPLRTAGRNERIKKPRHGGRGCYYPKTAIIKDIRAHAATPHKRGRAERTNGSKAAIISYGRMTQSPFIII